MLHRYSPVTKDWDETLHVVDQDFLNKYGSIDVTIPTGHVYEPNKGLLKVYLNGQRILEGGAYEEVDSSNIKLSLGTHEDGTPIRLEEGDEIYIEVYKNQYCSRGQETISGTQFYNLQKEIYDARKYRETDDPHDSLDDRIDHIQRMLEVIHGGEANVDIEYEYNAIGQPVREIVSGDYTLVREFTYYGDDNPTIKGELETETVYYTNHEGGLEYQVTKGYSYDPVTRNLLRTTVRSS